MIQRLTIHACLTNFNGSYISLVFLVIGTLASLFGPGGGEWLYRIGLVNAGMLGLLAGTTLTEIKVKPLSFCLPGQERTMGPAMVITAAIVSLLYSSLLLFRPMTSVDVSVIVQVLTLFCWSAGLYLLVVMSAALMRDSFINSTVLVAAFVLLIVSVSHPGISAGWLTLTTLLVNSPFLAMAFAALVTAWTLRTLGDRELSRDLCGSPYLPLKAFDNPTSLQDAKNRMRQTSFRPSFVTSNSGVPGGRLLVKLSERLAGSSWDYLLQESRLSGNVSEFLGKLFYVAMMIGLIVFLVYPDFESPLAGLHFLMAMIFLFFAPSFNSRMSPMLPVSRRQHFRSLLAKGAVIYCTAVVFILSLRFLVSVLEPSLPILSTTMLTGLAEFKFPTLLILALNVPILCWGFSVFRGTIGYIGFLFVYMAGQSVLLNVYNGTLLAMSLTEVLLLTAVCWIPFLIVAWKRSLRDDLLVP